MSVASIEELEARATRAQSEATIEQDKMCRITLAADWPRNVPLGWHAGKGSRPTMIILEPGKSVVQPLSKSQAWFGPFSALLEYQNTEDETRREKIKQFYAEEKTRYLDRYDYPRPLRGTTEGVQPLGPHRSPDVTVTILEADGTEHEPIRLYEMYRIGEYDPRRDEFEKKETPEQVKARYEKDLAVMSERYERDLAEMRLALAEVKGMQMAAQVNGGKRVAAGG